jgi:predicted alpha/beta hydrolase family esterase
VLVHGTWADGSSWAKVIPLLTAKGYHVTAVQNPLSSLADDVAATKRAIALQDGPVLLVGHSWGGVVITEAGTDLKTYWYIVAANDRIIHPDLERMPAKKMNATTTTLPTSHAVILAHLDKVAAIIELASKTLAKRQLIVKCK